MEKVDRLTSLFLLGICILIYVLTSSYPPGVALYPRLLIYVLGILSVFLFIFSFHQEAKEEEGIIIENWPLVLLVAIVSLLCILLLRILGFYLSLGLYIFSVMLLLKVHDWKKLVFITGGFILFVYVVFGMTLNTYFPKGLLFK